MDDFEILDKNEINHDRFLEIAKIIQTKYNQDITKMSDKEISKFFKNNLVDKNKKYLYYALCLALRLGGLCSLCKNLAFINRLQPFNIFTVMKSR